MHSTFNILVADPFEEQLLQKLNAAGYYTVYQPAIGRKEILELLPGFHGLVIRSKTEADAELMDCGRNLKFIARGGAGMDNVDEDAAAARGIICLNAGEANSDAVGEHAVGLLLDLFRHITRSHIQVGRGVWDREGNRGIELRGRTVGIIGYGNTGSAFARKLAGFGVKVLAYDKYKSGFSGAHVTECGPEEIQAAADVLSLHVPLTSETRHLVNAEYIGAFRKPIYLMNLCRGAVVKTEDVRDALRRGKILGFAADVLENEKLGSYSDSEKSMLDELLSSGKAVITPHIAGWTFESYDKISLVLAEKIIQTLKT